MKILEFNKLFHEYERFMSVFGKQRENIYIIRKRCKIKPLIWLNSKLYNKRHEYLRE
jgi:hypothetical protein